jgi:hypothetical protein
MELTIEQIAPGKTATAVAPRLPTAQIATNPNTDPQLLCKIAAGKDWELRRLVASNPNTPTDILWRLGIDFPEAILSNPIFKLLQLEHINLAAEIPPATLTSLLQCEQVPSNFMEYAVSQQDYSLWLAVAYNPHTPSRLLEKLAGKSRHQDRELIRAVAAHPQTSHALLAEIIDISIGVAQIVAENAQTPVKVLENILYKYAQISDPSLIKLVALHPHLNPRLLMQMQLAPSESAAQSLWLAKQLSTTATQLTELSQTDWDVLQLAVVRHPNTPGTIVDRIWHTMRTNQHHQPQINRLMYDSFVSNPHTSDSLRNELRKLLQW